MKTLGIEFAPLNVPNERRIQTLCVVWYLFLLLGSGIVGSFLLLYMFISTGWRWLALLYLTWMLYFDKKTCERGSRPREWFRGAIWWKHMKEYFPCKLEKVPGVELNPRKNYLFCCFPHGMFAIGPFSSFSTVYGGFKKLFPDHTIHLTNLWQMYYIPLLRDLNLLSGGCSASVESLSYILGNPGGGKVAALMVGGAAEAFYSRPGRYKIVYRRRKGFIKLALQMGSALVPVISFGEPDVYEQMENPVGSLLRKIQEVCKKWTGFAPLIPLGRGIFQYSFGIMPFRRPITTLVGHPIEVEKTEAPTQKQIDSLHHKFMEELVRLFQEQKHNYIKEADNVEMEIE